MNIYNRAKLIKWTGTQGSVVLLALLVSACATNMQGRANESEQSRIIAEKMDAYIFNEEDIRHDIKDKNVARLWRESEILHRNGDIGDAMGRLEQALTISPRDPFLWSRAAEFALDSDSNLRAENYAAKSNFLAALGNQSLRYRNWLIIQRSREARGDLLGARDAGIEATKLN